MTNKEDEGEGTCGPQLETLLAINLVSQVLDEAYVIANAATDSGQPWRYLEMLKSFRSGQLKSVEEDLTFCASKMDDDDATENKIDAVANVVATSTPQKVAIDENSKIISESSFIGQGDEDMDMRLNEMLKSTSMFINHLFDMSEVERVIICDDTQVIQADSNDILMEAMAKIMESYVNTALGIAFGQELETIETIESCGGDTSPSTENSGYSFLADAYDGEAGNNDAFCEDEEVRDVFGTTSAVIEVVQKQDEQSDVNEVVKKEDDEIVKKHDVDFYENTYLTLNRDYDQCSDEDGDPILQDTKVMCLQEVELMTMNTSNENSPRPEEPLQPKCKEFLATSAVSASASGSRKSNLVQRCRTQGARLLACIRGWWRRKAPGKRKEARVPGSVRGLCPLSPDARRRAASLFDQRRLCSSPPSEHVVWKFNTVSEALVNSSRWKNYTFEVTPDECGEY